MAKFKCKNCDTEFVKFCDKLEDSLDVKCTNCGSHWIESVFEKDNDVPFKFPTLPYTDPPYPKPWIGDPLPPPKYKYWCGIVRPSEW